MSGRLLSSLCAAVLALNAFYSAAATPVPQDNVQAFSPDSVYKRYNTFVSWCSPEKLYLHLDRAYFAAGESIWFQGYLDNASPRALLPTSNYIYAELLNPVQDVVERVKIKKDRDGGFPGCLELPENIETGYYTLRAYTLWQLNSSPEYMFHQRIKILGPAKYKEKESKKTGIDVSFYPEGGRWYVGSKAAIGFKAVDGKGRSLDLRGWLVNQNGENIVPVETSHDGMGLIGFIPRDGDKYWVEFTDGQRFALPAPSTEGASLSMITSGDYAYLGIKGPATGKHYLFARDISELRSLVEIDLDGREKKFKLPFSEMAPGINQFILTDAKGSIISERLCFVFSGDTPVCKVEALDEKPGARALLRSNLYLTDNSGKPLDGRFSVSVVRGSFKDFVQDQGIVSFTGLTSELRGPVNDADHYFDESVPLRKRKSDIDLLMMIQGWTYFDLPQYFRTDGSSFKIKHLKELVQTAKVKVERILSSRIPRNYFLNIFIPRLNYFDRVLIDRAKYITLDSLDFEEGTKIVLNVERENGGFDYIPRWYGDKFAPSFKYGYPAGQASAVIDEGAIPLASDVAMADTLQAAVVTASTGDVFGELANARSVPFADLSFYKDRSLVEYVSLKTPAFIYNGETMVNRRFARGGSIEIQEETEDMSIAPASEPMDTGSETGTVKLIVDGTEEPWFAFDDIYLESIAAISISTQADAGYASPGGIVHIKLKSGVGVPRGDAKPSLLLFVPLGHQVPRYFYSPRYDRGETSSEFDHRHTVYWNPGINVSRGLASIEFCNTDQMDYPYIIRIEGKTSDGRPFSLHTTLDYK